MRSAFRVGNEFAQRFVRLLLIDDDDHRIRSEARDRDEVGPGELGLAPEQLVDLGKAGEGRNVREERVAVRQSGGDELGTNCAGSPRFRFDDDRLLDYRLKRRRKRTRDNFRRPSGRKWIDDRNGPRGITALRECNLAYAELQPQARRGKNHGWICHVSSPAYSSSPRCKRSPAAQRNNDGAWQSWNGRSRAGLKREDHVCLRRSICLRDAAICSWRP
jgi:hypothetical protein